MMPASLDTEERLAEAERCLDEHRARIEALETLITRPTLSRTDVAALIALLPVLGGVFGASSFTTSEAMHHPSAALRYVLGSRSSGSLGCLLARGVRHVVEGYVLERLGREGHRVLWVVGRIVVP